MQRKTALSTIFFNPISCYVGTDTSTAHSQSFAVYDEISNKICKICIATDAGGGLQMTYMKWEGEICSFEDCRPLSGKKNQVILDHTQPGLLDPQPFLSEKNFKGSGQEE